MNYAVVVGIGDYPLLSAEGFANLDGPDNDAQAVYDWLVDGDGGGLEPGHVRLVRSAEFDPPDEENPQPAAAAVERHLKWVEEQTRQRAGDRLYLYFSGHGFSPVLEEGALYTADASAVSPEHVYAHSWLRWFRRAGRFRQSVLWMDVCMNPSQSVPVREVGLRARLGTGVPGPAFIGLAAQTRSALESTMPDGQVHGVFTWTLLQGLRGGAADERGRITGESLKSFLHNTMPEFLPESVRGAAAFDLQPFVRADDGMVFRRLPARPKYPVELAIPTATAGQRLTIWTGRPPYAVVAEPLHGPSWKGELVRGLYVAEVADAGLREGFQVSGAGITAQTISVPGPPVTPGDGSQLFELHVTAANPAASIVVADHRFDRVFADTGELRERDLSGVYKIRTELGRDITSIREEILLLDRDTVRTFSGTSALTSAAPIPGSSATHEHHMAAVAQAYGPAWPFTEGGQGICVVARYWTGPGERSPATLPHPMAGLTLHDDQGLPVATMTESCLVEDLTEHDPIAIWALPLAAGVYYLRQRLATGTFEGSVAVCPGWVTEIALRRPTGRAPGGDQGAEQGGEQGGEQGVGTPVADAAAFMRPAAGGGGSPEADSVVEAARLSLVEKRDLFGEGRGAGLLERLVEEGSDPVGTIIAGHLLLRAIADQSAPDPAQLEAFDDAVVSLRRRLRSSHPDVEALSLRCADESLRTRTPFTAPPMFLDSWQLVSDATYTSPELVPEALWSRVHASTQLGAMFLWATDDSWKHAHQRQLAGWAHGMAEPRTTGTPERMVDPANAGTAPSRAILEEVRSAGRRLGIPAAAAAQLWRETS